MTVRLDSTTSSIFLKKIIKDKKKQKKGHICWIGGSETHRSKFRYLEIN